jgi:alginate O-acetyltransferase complex protein AlgI
MQLSSVEFLLFVALSVVAFRLAPRRWRPDVLLVASYIFYCTWNPGMAVALLAITVICYYAALYIESSRGRPLAPRLTLVVVAALILYIVAFKARAMLYPGVSLAIPLGISYYTFRLISYLLDVYWGTVPAERSLVPFAAYVAFFPQMMAGPIERASSFLPQFEAEGNPWRGKTFEGATCILLGFFKKFVVADNLALIVDYGYRHLDSGSSLPNILSFYLYPLQLYADFSGLADIALGIGLLFGLKGPENFNAPFSASSISEYWRRWHMTLTSWLRDYVFMPLRMATRHWGTAGLVVSVVANMMLIALWHGFTLGFIVFGLVNATFLVVDVLTSTRRQKFWRRHPGLLTAGTVVGMLATYHIVSLSETFFRAPSFADAAHLLDGLAAGFGDLGGAFAAVTAPPNHHAWVALPAYVLTEIADAVRRKKGMSLPAGIPRWVQWSAVTCVAVACVFMSLLFLARQTGTNPFVYANF